jgi:transcriptional regulator with XRE-family HTH domain
MTEKNDLPHINVDYFEDLTGSIPEPGPSSIEEIGNRIKSLREEKGVSIEALAKMTGFSPELLAQIESREVLPQLGTVMKLSKALDAAVSRLISGAGDRPYAITRRKDQKSISRSTAKQGRKHIYSYKGLAPEVKGRNMEPLIVQLVENSEKDLSQHDGEEFIYVLQGIVILEIGEERFELEPGDSAYYISSTPHWLASKTGHATILAVIYNK